MLLLYRISIYLYHLLIEFLAPFNHRARLFARDRKNVFLDLQSEFKVHPGKVVWFHAASLGEYEQARPVIERLKNDQPTLKILVTFFSPSGYRVVKAHALLDYVHYLPEDSPNNACQFMELVRPQAAIFVKYELWYFFLTELKRNQIPTILISGIFRRNQLYFHPAGQFYKPAFLSFTHFFLQDEFSGVLLRKIGLRNFTVTGDTRFDRVVENAKSHFSSEVADGFTGNAGKVIILGSVWPSDMEHLWPLINEYEGKAKFIIAPHQIRAEALVPFSKLSKHVFYSEARGINLSEQNVLVVDEMGILSKLYRYADLAIVGGAFRGTLHNVLEPAVYGIPVLFGTHENNDKFIEAIELQNHGGGFTFENYQQLSAHIDGLLGDEQRYREVCEASREFVNSRAGASAKIVSKLKEWV